MLTLDVTDSVFETNANQTGNQRFEMVKKGSAGDKNVYIYRRTFLEGPRAGKVFAYEVFIPKVLKAGTIQKFPGGKEILIEQDTEEYANGAKTDFGKRAWFCASLERAEARFDQLTQIQIEDSNEETESEVEVDNSPRVRGRPKADRPVLTLPVIEFSVKELAEANKVDYPVAFLFLKEMEEAGKVLRTRQERRAVKGKPTQLFKAI